MKKIFAMLLVLAVAWTALAGPEALGIDIYKFKKDRVDQEIDGNQGYIMGPKPPAKDRTGIKRTLIGVDIELPSSVMGEGGQGEAHKAESAPDPGPRKKQASQNKTATVVVEQDTQEEVWIK